MILRNFTTTSPFKVSLHKLGFLIGLSATVLSGCSEFSRAANPVIGKEINDGVNALTTRAERRIVLSQKVTNTSKIQKYPGAHIVCAEPSPDAIEAIAASLGGSASLNQSGGSEAKAEILQTLATSSSVTLRKTQGLQLFRDGVFALCQGAMNGIDEADEFVELFKGLQAASVKLIMAEIKTSNWNTVPQVTIVNPPAVQTAEPKQN